jgi:histidine ammonia-lyase
VLRHVEQVLALELLCAGQGLDFRIGSGPRPGVGVADAHRRLRERVAHLESDRDQGPDIVAATDLIRQGALLELLPA